MSLFAATGLLNLPSNPHAHSLKSLDHINNIKRSTAAINQLTNRNKKKFKTLAAIK